MTRDPDGRTLVYSGPLSLVILVLVLRRAGIGYVPFVATVAAILFHLLSLGVLAAACIRAVASHHRLRPWMTAAILYYILLLALLARITVVL